MWRLFGVGVKLVSFGKITSVIFPGFDFFETREMMLILTIRKPLLMFLHLS